MTATGLPNYSLDQEAVMDTVKDFARLDPETAREKYNLP